MDGIADPHAAFNPQSTNGGNVLERAAACCLIEMASIAQAVLSDQALQIRFRLVQHDAGAAGRLALSQTLRFEQRHLDPGRGEHVRDDASDGAAAHDRDLRLKMSAMPGIRRSPRRGKSIQPVANAVARFGQGRNILVDGRWSKVDGRSTRPLTIDHRPLTIAQPFPAR